jgi:hypothetical protein
MSGIAFRMARGLERIKDGRVMRDQVSSWYPKGLEEMEFEGGEKLNG